MHAALALMCLSACAPGEGGLVLSGQAAGGQIGYVAPLLAQGKRDFFGGGGGDGGGGGSGGGSGGLGGDFGISEPVMLSGAPPRVASLSLKTEIRQDNGWSLRPSLTLSHQSADVFLPQGLGVFTDPMQIDMQATGLSAALVLTRTHDLGDGWRAYYGAGVGMQMVAARAHFASALIDLHSTVEMSQPFITATGSAVNSQGSGILGELLLFRDGSPEYRLGLMQSF